MLVCICFWCIFLLLILFLYFVLLLLFSSFCFCSCIIFYLRFYFCSFQLVFSLRFGASCCFLFSSTPDFLSLLQEHSGSSTTSASVCDSTFFSNFCFSWCCCFCFCLYVLVSILLLCTSSSSYFTLLLLQRHLVQISTGVFFCFAFTHLLFTSVYASTFASAPLLLLLL